MTLALRVPRDADAVDAVLSRPFFGYATHVTAAGTDSGTAGTHSPWYAMGERVVATAGALVIMVLLGFALGESRR